MDTPIDKGTMDEVKREYGDWIKSQPGFSGVDWQASRVLVFTNAMMPETKAAIVDKLRGKVPVDFYEIGTIYAQGEGEPAHR